MARGRFDRRLLLAIAAKLGTLLGHPNDEEGIPPASPRSVTKDGMEIFCGFPSAWFGR